MLQEMLQADALIKSLPGAVLLHVRAGLSKSHLWPTVFRVGVL